MNSTKKRDMSLSQTYVLAHTARAKLSREAAKADHQLRLLVGHANMLDMLMVELADAERQREAWFNQTIQSKPVTSISTTTPTAPAPVAVGASKRVQWLDTVVRVDDAITEEDEDDDEEEWDASSDSDSDDSDYETDGDFFVDVLAKHTFPAPSEELYPIKYTPVITTTNTTATTQVDSAADSDDLSREYDDAEFDDYDDGDDLTLTRTPSRQHQPPELLDDLDGEESEDDILPLSPPQPSFDTFSTSHESGEDELVTVPSTFTKQTHKDIHADVPSPRLSEVEQSSFLEDGFFIPPRNPARTSTAIVGY